MDTSPIFEPVEIKGLSLRNRFVMAPMTRYSADPQTSAPTEAVADYYARRARGGVALIVSEGVAIDHPSASSDKRVPALSTPGQVAAWRSVTEAVHQEGGLIAAQLWHVGRARTIKNAPFSDYPTLSASNLRSRVPSPRGGPYARPKAMTLEEICEVEKAYGRSAALAREAGFDAVEIHGAHGYLIDQFLWEPSNNRNDNYGGSFEKRLSFAVEVVEEVRRLVGDDFPVIFRFSQWKQDDYEARLAETPAELKQLLIPLKKAGVDAFHASQRDHAVPAFEGSDLNLAGWAKRLTGLPAISVGKVGLALDFLGSLKGKESGLRPLDSLIEQVSRGDYDLIAVGRALIADPEFVLKVKEGRFGEVVPYKNSMLEKLY